MPPSRNALRPLARRPRRASSCHAGRRPNPAGSARVPILQPVADEVRHALQRLRRRQRFWRIAQRLHPPPERGEHAQVRGSPCCGSGPAKPGGRRGSGAQQCLSSQRGGNLIFHGPVWGLRDLVPIDRLGADLAGERCDDRRRRSLAQHQRGAPLRRLACRARNDCASHHRAAPPGGRMPGALSSST